MNPCTVENTYKCERDCRNDRKIIQVFRSTPGQLNPTTRRILEILAASPEVSRKDIAGIVGIAGPSITWHTKRLKGDGIISTSKTGRAVRYTLCPAGLNVFRQFTGESAGEPSGSADSRGSKRGF